MYTCSKYYYLTAISPGPFIEVASTISCGKFNQFRTFNCIEYKKLLGYINQQTFAKKVYVQFCNALKKVNNSDYETGLKNFSEFFVYKQLNLNITINIHTSNCNHTALVESIAFNRRVVGSTPALAAM